MSEGIKKKKKEYQEKKIHDVKYFYAFYTPFQ